MPMPTSSRSLALALLVALPAAAALAGLPLSGSPVLAGSPPAPAQQARPAPAALAAHAALQQARPLPADPAAVPAVEAPVAAPVSRAVTDLLRRQVEAGLDCTLTSRQLPVCGHGDDAAALEHDHASHGDAGHGAGTARAESGGSTGSTGSIGCYGDGRSGPRMHAVYARPQSSPDRYNASVGAIRGWAAGLSKQFDTGAARTNGRRHVRFATTPGSSCSVVVLNLVLPDSAFTSFAATVNALEARGLDAPASKYLVWSDGTGYCGVASSYVDDAPGLDNLNNGRFPSYARIDRRCWGKVETHEVVHMLGGVQRSAPHATAGGHCNDGTDLMCYADGTAGSTQRSVCSTSGPAALDCRNDDYFSTAAPRGSYLQTHWNVARSSFLSATLSEPAAAAPRPAPATSPAPSPSPSPSPSASPPPKAPSLLPLPLPTLGTLSPALPSLAVLPVLR